MRKALSVSAGLKDVCSDVRDEDGTCLLRIFDRVDLNFLRIRCGTKVGIDGHDTGIFGLEKKRCVPSLSRRKE